MADIYVFDFGAAGRELRARRQAERARVRAGCVARLCDVGLDALTAEIAVAAIFDRTRADGELCECSCHPQLSTLHGDGTDCSCTWDEERRLVERKRMTAWWDSPAAKELRAHHEAEEAAIAAWVRSQVGVDARRTTTDAPEQWEGIVDGHTFYFRERHGEWRIELDLAPSGRFVNRWLGVDDDGEAITEPVELDEGEVIARGVDADLGDAPVDHAEFIVRTIRNELRRRHCDHAVAASFCPACGMHMDEQ